MASQSVVSSTVSLDMLPKPSVLFVKICIVLFCFFFGKGNPISTILSHSLPHVPSHGWTSRALTRGCTSTGLPPGLHTMGCGFAGCVARK